jgi:hypothetical protein
MGPLLLLRQLISGISRKSSTTPAARAMTSQATAIGGHEYDFDVVVIGGGSGGLATSKECAKHGAKVRVRPGFVARSFASLRHRRQRTALRTSKEQHVDGVCVVVHVQQPPDTPPSQIQRVLGHPGYSGEGRTPHPPPGFARTSEDQRFTSRASPLARSADQSPIDIGRRWRAWTSWCRRRRARRGGWVARV